MYRRVKTLITFLIGGGGHQGKTCLNLLIDDKIVASATGANDNRMRPGSLDVRRWAGQTGRLPIVDDESGGWGNIGVDYIVFSDRPSVPEVPLDQEPDFGTMGIALLDVQGGDAGENVFAASAVGPSSPAQAVFEVSGRSGEVVSRPLEEPLIGGLGRWYAMPGEAGLLMCTFPRSGWDHAQTKGKGPEWAAGYFNECMNGFEYQAAGHMIWEGMVQYHGPKGHLGFSPRLKPEAFRAAFTAAEGWGTFEQKTEGRRQRAAIEVKCGKLGLKTLSLGLVEGVTPVSVQVRLGGRPVEAGLQIEARRSTQPSALRLGLEERLSTGRAVITLPSDLVLGPEEVLEVTLS